MPNFNIRLDLLRLQGAFTRNLKGKTTTKRCLIIPIDDNPGMFLVSGTMQASDFVNDHGMADDLPF